MPTEIVSGVYDITCRSEAGGKRYRVFFRTAGTPTLLDAGLEETTDAVIDAIDEVDVEPERLVVTHGDRDHVGGFDGIAEEYDLETWVPEQTTAEFETDPTYRYGDGDRIGEFVAVHAPGHSRDNHALVDEDAGIVVMGDAASGADQRGHPSDTFTSLQPSIRRT